MIPYRPDLGDKRAHLAEKLETPKPRRSPTCFTCREPEHPGRKLLRATPISPLTCGDCIARGVPLAKQLVKEPERIKYHAGMTPTWDWIGDL